MGDLEEQAPALQAQGIQLVSTAEKTGIQALERAEATNPRQPGVAGQAGKSERQEDESIRHGTHCLTANFEVATGNQIAPRLGETRTEADLVAPLAQTVSTAPNDPWIFLADQLHPQPSESLVRGVASQIGETSDLGEKGKSGIVKAMSAGAEFLANWEHRIRFV